MTSVSELMGLLSLIPHGADVELLHATYRAGEIGIIVHYVDGRVEPLLYRASDSEFHRIAFDAVRIGMTIKIVGHDFNLADEFYISWSS